MADALYSWFPSYSVNPRIAQVFTGGDFNYDLGRRKVSLPWLWGGSRRRRGLPRGGGAGGARSLVCVELTRSFRWRRTIIVCLHWRWRDLICLAEELCNFFPRLAKCTFGDGGVCSIVQLYYSSMPHRPTVSLACSTFARSSPNRSLPSNTPPPLPLLPFHWPPHPARRTAPTPTKNTRLCSTST